MKILSQRQISTKLVLLRLIFILTTALITWLFITNHPDYAVLLIILLVVGLTITINQVTIYKDTVILSSYYLFGFMHINHCLNINNILTMTPYEEYYEFENDALFDLNIGIGFVGLLLPNYKMVDKYTEFNYTNNEKKIKRLTTKLREAEFKLAWKVLNGQMY